MDEQQRRAVTAEMIRGFNDTAIEAGTLVTGGQTVMNPWPIIGGVAMSVCRENEFIRPCHGEAGDVLVLTKPIGTQLVVNLYEWFFTKRHLYERLNPLPSEDLVHESYSKACFYMSALNKVAAELMIKYSAKGATDVTGFGILGHAKNLASVQHKDVSLKLHTLPIIEGMTTIDKQIYNFKLVEGYSAETSGGLLVILPRDKAESFVQEFQEREGRAAWIIGEVIEGNKDAFIEPEVKILQV